MKVYYVNNASRLDNLLIEKNVNNVKGILLKIIDEIYPDEGVISLQATGVPRLLGYNVPDIIYRTTSSLITVGITDDADDIRYTVGYRVPASSNTGRFYVAHNALEISVMWKYRNSRIFRVDFIYLRQERDDEMMANGRKYFEI